MKKLLTALSLCLTLSVTNACVPGLTDLGSSPPPLVVGDYCQIAKPIPYDSRGDTPETVKAVEAHNSRFVCVCENDCPKVLKET